MYLQIPPFPNNQEADDDYKHLCEEIEKVKQVYYDEAKHMKIMGKLGNNVLALMVECVTEEQMVNHNATFQPEIITQGIALKVEEMFIDRGNELLACRFIAEHIPSMKVKDANFNRPAATKFRNVA